MCDFLGEATLVKVIQTKPEEISQALEVRRARQRAFLKRKQPESGVKSADWRPRKRHRRSAWQWLCALHHQISQFHPSGLLHFCVPPAPETPSPILWPRLSISPDQGSDGTAALCFMVWSLGCNVDVAFDPSHACWNDLLVGIKSANLYRHLLLSLIRLNVPTGPWSEDMRYKQCLQGLQELLSTETPQSCPLFQAFLPDMLAEEAGKDLQTDSDPAGAMWRRLSESNPFSTKGTKVVLGRFMDVLRKSRDELRHFHQRRFIYLYVALEGDMLHGSNFTRLALGDPAPVKTTDSRRESAEEAALRRACANQLVLATMFMLDPDTEMIEWLFVVTTEHWEAWHGRQNTRLRSCHDSLPWLQDQLHDEFLRTAALCLQTIGREVSLQRCQFILPHPNWVAPAEGVIQREDDMAKHMAHLVMGIDFARIRRCAWMLLGWSSRSSLFLFARASQTKYRQTN